jgi:hypothetical protein
MELMVGSKIVPTTFFMVDVKGRYNMLLELDWIHTNECVLSNLHQCVIQWIDDEVEVVQAGEEVCCCGRISSRHPRQEDGVLIWQGLDGVRPH